VDKKKIIAWALFDWGNSSFSAIITTFIFAAYFTRQVAENQIIGTHQWGNAIALSGLLVAILGPIFGAIADYGGARKRWLGVLTVLAIIGASMLWFAAPTQNAVNITLAAVVIGTLGIEIGMVFYNALLLQIAPPNYIGRISGWGWGAGYAGGLTAMVICLFGFVEGQPHWLNAATSENIRICGPFVAMWFGVFAIPLFLFVPDQSPAKLPLKKAVKRGLFDLINTLKTLPQHKDIMFFLIARLFYIDGLNTVFAFAGIYAAGTFGMTVNDIIKFGIIMNIAAGWGAALFAWIDDYYGAKPTILFSLCALTLLTSSILLVHSRVLFWALGILLSLFVGPVQAASRSLMARLVPPKKANELFGLYAFSGKVTSFFGPWILAYLTFHFDSQRIGMSSVVGFFVVGGFILFKFVPHRVQDRETTSKP